MNQLLRASALLLLGSALSFDLHAQGMATAAEKEKQRRAQQSANGPAKAFSDEDLGRIGAPLANDTSIPPAAAGQSGAASRPAASTTTGESPANLRLRQAREALAAAEQGLHEAAGSTAGAELARLRANQIRADAAEQKLKQAAENLKQAEAAALRVRLGNCREIPIPQPAGQTTYPAAPATRVQCDPAAPFANNGQAGVDAARAAWQRAQSELALANERARKAKR
jgi:hypothetical protein